jgi:hypothetical protein
MLGVMALSGWLSTRNSPRQRFLLYRKMRKLDYKKLLKWYLYIQSFLLGNKLLGNEKLDWITVFAMPVVIITLLVIYFFFMYYNPSDMDFELSDEFDSYKKQFERDEKLKKILK